MKLRDSDVLVGVSFVVSFANAISHGRYLGPALALLAAALLVLALRFVAALRGLSSGAVIGGEPPAWGAGSDVARISVWSMLMSMPITALLDPKILFFARSPFVALRALELISALLVSTYLPFLGTRVESSGLRRARFFAFSLVTLLSGLVVIHVSPAPTIDVWDLQMQGAKALLHGENPYVTVSVPDTSPVDPLPHVPFVYAPGTVYADVVGMLLGGDVRYAMLLALVLTGFALRATARGSQAARDSSLPSLIEDAPALLVWLMPPLAFIIELSWTEPVQLGLICGAVLALLRHRALLGAMLVGLAATSKQSMFWLLPLAGVVFQFTVRQWVGMLATVTLIVAPFAVANFGALKYDNVDHFLHLVQRPDALSAAAWCTATFGRSLPPMFSVVVVSVIVTLTLVCVRLAGKNADRAQVAVKATLFARAAAFTYFAWFFFAKQAFANYYYLVAGLAALAAATSLRANLVGRPGIEPGTYGLKVRSSAD